MCVPCYNRVLFHALLYPAVEWAFGIEFDPVKVLKAVAAFDYLMQKMPVFKAAMKNKSAPPKANCASISEVRFGLERAWFGLF